MPPRRTALVLMTMAAGSAALFIHFDSFWGLFVAALVFIWVAFGLLPFMDGTWRLKAGFVAAVFAGSLVVLWPTVDSSAPRRERRAVSRLERPWAPSFAPVVLSRS